MQLPKGVIFESFASKNRKQILLIRLRVCLQIARCQHRKMCDDDHLRSFDEPRPSLRISLRISRAISSSS